MDMTPFIVYGLVDPKTQELRYVGKSSSRLSRPQEHQLQKNLAKDPNLKKAAWIMGLLAEGTTYDIVVLQECDSADELLEAESFHINLYRMLGCDLTNIKGGGESKVGKIRKEVTQPPYREAKRAWETDYFSKMATETGGNIPAMVFATGMHRSTLYDKMKELGIWS
jgi:DNA-binding NtrC family response regulator